MNQSKSLIVHFLGMGLTLVALIITIMVYKTIRAKEDVSLNRVRYTHKGAMLVAHAIAVFTMGLGMFIWGRIFLGPCIILITLFLGYEGWRAMKGYNFFFPIKPKKAQ